MAEPPESNEGGNQFQDEDDMDPGVYAEDEPRLTLVHAYTDGEYSLSDISTHFGLGEVEELEDDITLILDGKELRELKVNADAYSFDYDPGFIEMCTDIHHYAGTWSDGKLRLRSIE